MSLALFLLAAVLALLGVHPFVTYPASLALIARRRPAPDPPAAATTAARPRVALCVCAYNEAGIIDAKARNMLALRERWPGLDLLVFVDAASDDTAAILARYRPHIAIVESRTRQGKSFGMNTLVASTAAELVVFSDANVMFAPDAIEHLVAAFADPAIGCACGHLIYTASEGSVTATTGALYWRLEETIKRLETRTGSTAGADGSIFAIRRALHRPPPPDIIDDMFVSLSILCDGYRVVRVGAALAYEETVSRPGEEFRRKVRIGCQAFNVNRLLWHRLVRLPWLDRYKYISHKLLRWLAGFTLVGSALSFLGALAAASAWGGFWLVILLLAGGFAVGRAWPNSLPGKLLDIAAAFAATGIGVLRSLRGDRFQTWTPPASARARS